MNLAPQTHLEHTAGMNCVYCIHEDTDSGYVTILNARYVGKTDDFHRRFDEHMQNANAHRNGSRTAALACDQKIASGVAAGKHYTMDCIVHNITADQAEALEHQYIESLATFAGDYPINGWNQKK